MFNNFFYVKKQTRVLSRQIIVAKNTIKDKSDDHVRPRLWSPKQKQKLLLLETFKSAT